ncbi:MAG TPA: NAD(P)/FAD-dependent oxidoreductase [Acidobacteriaceae bacterium]|nr:NAD(P)/FAD-dependent oxidoreductase [Acidobacteriaceae bacterium]
MPTTTPTRARKACIIGSGPNGLSAAIVLAQAGLEVELFEAEPTIGGATRTLPLTLPGFLHDFGSAVHPFAAGSPFFATLPLADYGLEWIHSPAVLAHPLDHHPTVLLERDLSATAQTLAADGPAWRALIEALATQWPAFASEILQPLIHIPRHPLLLAQFGSHAILPATTLARRHFHTPQAKALFAGLAAHSFMPLNRPLSASFGLVLAAAAHAVGWPIPRGGSQSLANALAAHLTHLGGSITTHTRIHSLTDLPACDLVLLDVTPRQLLALAPPGHLTEAYRRQLHRFQYGPGAFKVDYALSAPIPWNDPASLRAASLHLGGTLAEIAASESTLTSRPSPAHPPARPYVLLSQPTLFDPTRAPAGKHIAWAYTHVPNAQTHPTDPESTLTLLEDQIERFAKGFRATILARNISTPATLESMNHNLIGGDISGGAMNLRQLLFRPTRRQYRTSAPDLFLCSSSTPPGGGVHGMCGFHAAHAALRHIKP